MDTKLFLLLTIFSNKNFSISISIISTYVSLKTFMKQKLKTYQLLGRNQPLREVRNNTVETVFYFREARIRTKGKHTSVKTVPMSCSPGHMVSVTTPRFRHRDRKATEHITQMSGCGCAPMKLHLKSRQEPSLGQEPPSADLRARGVSFTTGSPAPRPDPGRR